MITAYINLCSLSSWLSLAGLKEIQQGTGVTIHWQPMLKLLGNVTPPPKTDDPLADFKNRRAQARQQFLDAEHKRVCERLQITEAAGASEYDTLHVSLGLDWLTDQAGSHAEITVQTFFDYMEAVFAAHYRDSQNLESLEAAAGLLSNVLPKSLKAKIDSFHQFVEARAETLRNSADELLEAGILYSPAFVVEQEIFHGRQHLPLIAWMLKGRQGPPPV